MLEFISQTGSNERLLVSKISEKSTFGNISFSYTVFLATVQYFSPKTELGGEDMAEVNHQTLQDVRMISEQMLSTKSRLL